MRRCFNLFVMVGGIGLAVALTAAGCGSDSGSSATSNSNNNDSEQPTANGPDQRLLGTDTRALDTPAARTLDAANLRSLVQGYITGKASTRLPTPSSTGLRFWIALFVGDGPGGRLPAPEPGEDLYLSLSAADLLRSPGDPNVMPLEELQRELRRLIDSGEGAAGANRRMCSYAGPAGTDSNNYPDMALSRRNSHGIIGATGIRNGESFFADGFNVVTRDGDVRFLVYDELASEYGYDRRVPHFGESVLEFVEFESQE